MPILNNVFGGDDSEQSSNNQNNADADASSNTDAMIAYETHSEDMDEDGETTSSHDSGALGTNVNTDALLDSMTGSSSSSQSDSDDGGLLG